MRHFYSQPSQHSSLVRLLSGDPALLVAGLWYEAQRDQRVLMASVANPQELFRTVGI